MCTVIVLLVGLVRINCTRLSMYEIFCDNEIVICCFVLHQVLVRVILIWQQCNDIYEICSGILKIGMLKRHCCTVAQVV